MTDDTRGPPPARTLTDRTLSAMIWQFSSKVFEAVGRLAVMIILARLLNPHAFGVASAGLVIAGLATTLSQLGVAQALVQRRVLDTAHTSTAFIFAVASGAAAGLIMALLAEPISAFFGMPELHRVTQVIATSLPISAGAAVAEAALSRRLRFATISSIDALSFAVGYGATGILLAYAGYGLWSLIGAQLAYTALRSGALLLVNPEVLSWRFERNALQDLLRFGAGHSIAELGNFAALQGDNIVVGRYMGAVSLGLYERSYAFMAQPTRMIGLVFDLVLFPAMATVQDDSARLRRVLNRSLASIAIITIPVSVAMVVLAPELVILALGPKWVAMTPAFQILAASLVFRTSYKVSDAVARAAGAAYRRAWRQWVYAIMVFSGAWLGHFYGLPAVALGVACAILFNFLLMLQLSVTLVNETWLHLGLLYARIMAGMVPTASAILLSDWLCHRHDLSAAPTSVIVLGVTAVTVMLSLFRYASIFGQDGIWLNAIIRSRLPLRFHAVVRD